uniref:Ig-like domain-containing protein n=1 Tax=Oreochromis niloticus TaxID=8128 RepID=A0A669DGT9_ORENI
MEELLCLLVVIVPLSCAATPVRLTMSPNYLQYFKEKRFILNCEGGDGSADWNVMRNTNLGPTRSAMTLPWDTGVYWCESKNGQTSEMQNLTVTAGSVILQTGVALPITEGDDLTLVCVTKKPTKNWSAFYKDGALISSVPTGRLTIRNVAKSDEGVYNCETERDGKSPSSWIAVTETTRGEFVSEGPLLESTSPETTTGVVLLQPVVSIRPPTQRIRPPTQAPADPPAPPPTQSTRRPSAFVRRPRAPADPAHSSPTQSTADQPPTRPATQRIRPPTQSTRRPRDEQWCEFV